MQHLEATTLDAYWPEVEKYNKRRRGTFGEDDRTITVRFYRHGNSVVCEMLREPIRLALGLSHKSHQCEVCTNPGDRWDEKRGKVLALWSAMRDLDEELDGAEHRKSGWAVA